MDNENVFPGWHWILFCVGFVASIHLRLELLKYCFTVNCFQWCEVTKHIYSSYCT